MHRHSSHRPSLLNNRHQTPQYPLLQPHTHYTTRTASIKAVAAHHSHLDICPSLPSHSGRQTQWAAIKVGLSTVRGNAMPRRPRRYGMVWQRNQTIRQCSHRLQTTYVKWNKTHLKEVKEWNVINSIAEIWRMLEEEHAGESGVDDVGMTAWHSDEIEALLSTVATSPECQRWLVVPFWSGVRLDRHYVQRHSENTAM